MKGFGFEFIRDRGSKVGFPERIVEIRFFRRLGADLISLDFDSDHALYQISNSLDKAEVIISTLVLAMSKALESVERKLSLEGCKLCLVEVSAIEANGIG